MIRNGSIFVNSDICMGCAKMVANSGITHVHVKQDITEDTSHRSSSASYDFLIRCGIQVYLCH